MLHIVLWLTLSALVALREWSNFRANKDKKQYATVDINFSHGIKLTRIAFQNLVSRNIKGLFCSSVR
jgi:hypothetical protein